ncbi:MAG: phage GP46 family protein [Salinimicrobium sediminis]|nr:phage GP46 family protein [Salinimicrobium sediminis]
MALNANERRALLNMAGEGFTGPYPAPDGDLNNIPDLRHLLGLYRFEFINAIATPAGIAEDGDIYMEYDALGVGTKIFVQQTDFIRDKGLRTAVLISLLTDRIADLTDVLPDNTGDRRGWWADPTLGSKLWLLFRSSLTPDMPSRVEQASNEALQWMIDEGVASSVESEALISSQNTITWTIKIVKPGGKNDENFKFFFNWENELFGEIVNGVE